MSIQRLKKVGTEELKQIYRKIVFDFTLGEYPPYANIKRDLKRGRAELFLYQENGIDSAYTLCYRNPEDRIVLVSLLAVYKKHRGKGVGSRLLASLKEYYRHDKGIFLEVERPDKAASQKDRLIREKRIAFYEKSGFHLVKQIPYYLLWNIHYHVMAVPLSASEDELDEDAQGYLYRLYHQLLGDRYIKNLKFE